MVGTLVESIKPVRSDAAPVDNVCEWVSGQQHGVPGILLRPVSLLAECSCCGTCAAWQAANRPPLACLLTIVVSLLRRALLPGSFP
jgi:hypothetical protein